VRLRGEAVARGCVARCSSRRRRPAPDRGEEWDLDRLRLAADDASAYLRWPRYAI